MVDLYQKVVASQIAAALQMFEECITKCPSAHWDDPVGRYPFWMVAYHTLCWVDMYLSVNEGSWQPESGETGLHPKGIGELHEEYPSRRFDQAELIRYLEKCRIKLRTTMAAETETSLAGPSGFIRHPFTRAELHIYNLRHLAHHTGQLTAYLRRIHVETTWVKRA